MLILRLKPKNKYHFDQLQKGIPVTWEFETEKEAMRCYNAAKQWRAKRMMPEEMSIKKKENTVTCLME